MKIGDYVQLRNKPSEGVARIECEYADIKGGVKLDRKLDGFYSWNVSDLKKVKRPSKGSK